MTTQEKLQWCRDRWHDLKSKSKLTSALEKIIKNDNSLAEYTVEDIIEIEESVDEFYKGSHLK